ncbi:hypothetical protein [Nitrosospira sp. NpAV]|uniref:hypothetical protein n=1 Tax=Nitrosospira sp. NpAV TaxID=58133 RepID=UPI0006968BE6|nr:hypothetical protein [Nitrosospira sp. NpAV]
MQRIDTATKAVDLFGAGKHGFKDGNQSLGIAPTDLNAAIFNAIQEEIANVIEGAGMALDPGSRTQLKEALELSNFDIGTKLLFFQAAAPIGWTQITTHNNKALRIVSGPGGGSGGSVAFTTAFASQAVNGSNSATTLTTAQTPPHPHAFNVYNTGGAGSNPSGGSGGSPSASPGTATDGGSGGSHNHTFTGTAINLAVQYIDMILASKN